MKKGCAVVLYKNNRDRKNTSKHLNGEYYPIYYFSVRERNRIKKYVFPVDVQVIYTLGFLNSKFFQRKQNMIDSVRLAIK